MYIVYMYVYYVFYILYIYIDNKKDYQSCCEGNNAI